ncbi:MAG: putative transrane protein [Burkholderia sp.]|nr:putative transrane protein [Burkholderia sp.]
MRSTSKKMNNKHVFLLPVIGLVSNAFIWGVMWWPLKELRALGWHPLWSTTVIFLLATAGLLLFKRNAIWEFINSRGLWIIAIAAGVTNGAFSWGMAIGDVVRVILLFYLMPIWAVLFARLLLREPITRLAILRIVLALIGAGLVLKPEGSGLPVPSGLADWLGLVGGMAFAMNNVMIRREADRPRDGRAFAMFVGGLVIPGAVAAALSSVSIIQLPNVFNGYILFIVAGLGFAVLVANLALQYGAAKLPANVTAVVMLIEVVIAAVSSFIIEGTLVTETMIVGGALIITASALAALAGKKRTEPAAEQALSA